MDIQPFSKFRDDPRNFRWRVVYFCPDDPCLVIPKRRGYGWTINFAHKYALRFLFGLVILGGAPITFIQLIAIKEEWPPSFAIPVFSGIMLISISLIISIASKLSDRPLPPIEVK